MSFKSDNKAFETWLREQCTVVKKDLAYKHTRMRKNPFVFLRATYFRFASQVEKLCPEFQQAPEVLAVGDAHVENFGTWRDAEGRWVWGINDFDEAATMPYAFDLVRLAASVRLAPKLTVGLRSACDAVLQGYTAGLKKPRPTLLDEQETWMRPFVACSDEDREAFWVEVEKYPSTKPPPEVREGLINSLPPNATKVTFSTRRKGGGSLGRPRYVAVAAWRGGRIVREAKALVPSAWHWAHARTGQQSRFLDLARDVHRAPDPFLDVRSGYVFRRIAADSRKVELGEDAGHELKLSLLAAMGFELASVHAATEGAAKAVAGDLKGRADGWLQDAAKVVAAAVTADHKKWKN